MLLKTAQNVFVAGQPALPYRAYSKDCPPPPPLPGTKRWVTKQVCGTYSTFGFYAYNSSGETIQVRKTVYSVPGVNLPAVVSPTYDATQPTTPPGLLSTGPYCATVTVYE